MGSVISFPGIILKNLDDVLCKEEICVDIFSFNSLGGSEVLGDGQCFFYNVNRVVFWDFLFEILFFSKPYNTFIQRSPIVLPSKKFFNRGIYFLY